MLQVDSKKEKKVQRGREKLFFLTSLLLKRLRNILKGWGDHTSTFNVRSCDPAMVPKRGGGNEAPPAGVRLGKEGLLPSLKTTGDKTTQKRKQGKKEKTKG